ncbi:hypothetical protein CIL05_06935 [Virgibacillus profundi]|uniref:AAA+ ATPase domain-containing protein n=1 Tax=Virgibacillus profundi TaxID=2024555 RepID=A0A2A2IGD8_9BACI|nr:AAA family ATPase [Virgibacillus profundi]PAV30195.1 hypothetical protein CIL05_06935 [Virgibacillus profundi]PXY54367.1 hypothetical protein CIT14_07020 [Virgibacillus profundi]
MSQEEIMELNVTIKRKLYHSTENMWGVFAAIPNNNRTIELNSFGNIAISGNTADLLEGNDYNIIVEPNDHPKYGKGFTILSVEAKRPETIKEQQDYVKALITDKQYESIIKVYPNHKLLDMFDNDEIDYTKIHGIGESTYDKIKGKLVNNLEIQEALVELKEFDITYEATKRLINHFGSASALVQSVRNNVYNLCAADNFGFKKVDSYAMHRGDDPTSPHRIESAIRYTLEQDASSGHSWISRRELIEQLEEMLKIEESYIMNTIEELENSGVKETNLYIKDNKVALYKNYYFEKTIKDKLMSMLNESCPTSKVNSTDVIAKQEEQGGFEFTDEQRNAIQLAIDNNVLAINGKGGVGKTFSIKGVLKALKDYSYMTTALSGKATRVLASHGLESMTIHRMLGIDKYGKFIHNDKFNLPYDIVVLDESSMANNFLIYSVVIALKPGAKMIFVGDNGQLPSIGTGAVYDSILNEGRDIIPQQELTKIQRQAAKSGIILAANDIREGRHITDKYNYKQETLGELRDMTTIPVDKETDITDMILSICERNKNADLFEFQVLTGLRERGELSVKDLNIELQKVFNDTDKPFISRGGYDYRVGDKVIHNGNNYEAGESGKVKIYNGTLGRIVAIEFDDDKTRQNHSVHFQFEDIDEIIIYDMSEMINVELAYAITVHKSQGSSIKQVIFTFDFSAYLLLSREFVYTGITRASEGCIMIAENNALHYAIEQTAGGSRRTFLGDMLVEDGIRGAS